MIIPDEQLGEPAAGTDHRAAPMLATYPSLKGRCVLVTGGASGIGAELVTRFAAQGARVAYVDIQRDAGTALAEELVRAGLTVRFDVLDVTDVLQLQRCLDNIEETFGDIAVLVNNVANDARHDWRETTQATWRSALAVNLDPTFFTIQKLLPGMLQRRQGSIINIGSIAWKAKFGNLPGYAAAKAAIHGLTRAFMVECGASDVRINTVLPGWVMTDKQRALHYGPEGQAMLDRQQALRGHLHPADVAALVLFLAADDSRMCTGQEFTVDGGWI